MNLKAKLSERINLNGIYELLHRIHGSDVLKEELYGLLFDEDETVAYQAAWVFTHFNEEDNKWLFSRQNELIDEVLVCRHPGKRRLLLSLLNRQPVSEPIRVDFLDFCLEGIVSKKELPAVNSTCIKLAYELCRATPELAQELKTLLEIMEENQLPPSIRCARGKVLKAFRSQKSRKMKDTKKNDYL